jgi:hypothetical protein
LREVVVEYGSAVPVMVSIRSMILNRELGGVRLGMPRAEVRALLGEPDSWLYGRRRTSDVNRSPAWLYGTFEFYFNDDNAVRMLFIDHLRDLYAGKGRNLDKWLFDGTSGTDLSSVVQRLRDEHIKFAMLRDFLGRKLVCVAQGAQLAFDTYEAVGEVCSEIMVR